jgi:hypothetical protein
MQLPTNTKEQIDKLKEKISQTADPLFKKLIEDKIKVLYRQLSHESSMILLERDRQSRSVRNTHSTPIKCGLRNSTGGQMPDKQSHWYWDGVAENEAKQLERIRVKIQTSLFINPEKVLVQKMKILGGVSKTLSSLGLQGILQLPEETRKEKSKVILALIEQKLNGAPDKLPFC